MNDIKILEEDIKLWLGELMVQNRLLQKKIVQIEIELKRLKAEQETKYNILPVQPELDSQT